MSDEAAWTGMGSGIGITIAVEKIKQNIFAKSCYCLGFSTIVANLVSSHVKATGHQVPLTQLFKGIHPSMYSTIVHVNHWMEDGMHDAHFSFIALLVLLCTLNLWLNFSHSAAFSTAAITRTK